MGPSYDLLEPRKDSLCLGSVTREKHPSETSASGGLIPFLCMLAHSISVTIRQKCSLSRKMHISAKMGAGKSSPPPFERHLHHPCIILGNGQHLQNGRLQLAFPSNDKRLPNHSSQSSKQKEHPKFTLFQSQKLPNQTNLTTRV